MMALGPIGFTAPALLWALVVLPVLWLLLRAVPPAPVKRMFPGVALLLGLSDEDVQTARTPWWLLALRTLALALVIIGFAGPVLDPEGETAGTGPLVIVSDGSWALAPGWGERRAWVETRLERAAQTGRPVALVNLAQPPETLNFQTADAWARRIAVLDPKPWGPVVDQPWVAGSFDTLWLSDQMGNPGRTALYSALSQAGAVEVISWPRPVYALRPATLSESGLSTTLLRTGALGETEAQVAVIGLGPQGLEREFDRVTVTATGPETPVSFDLPLELRNRVTRLELPEHRSAGGVSLTGDTLRRREVALIAGGRAQERSSLLDPLHYLQQALAPTADLIRGTVLDVVQANPDAIVLADVADLADAEVTALTEWIDGGGALIRFAGPRMARAEEPDPLLPVRLRQGGRVVGGAMSWGAPKQLAPFPPDTPFAGLPVPEEVTISAQVLAQPDPELADRVMAQLADGTPLVTRKAMGQGQIVLFHVTANADWSGLPLSGLFVQMLDRLAITAGAAQARPDQLDGTRWALTGRLTANGVLTDAGTDAPVDGPRLTSEAPGPDLPPGLYQSEGRGLALNVAQAGTQLSEAQWPAGVAPQRPDASRALALKGWALAAALVLLAADVLGTLALSGRLLAATVLLALSLPPQAEAQTPEVAPDIALRMTSAVTLAHVITGDPRVDRLAEAGLTGLNQVLYRRTSVEPAPPVGVNLETDELSFFPLLYWPVTDSQPLPSPAAYAKLNRYLASGGMIVFDTRDADIAGFGSGTPEAQALRVLAAPLDIPPLEPIPPDHILTRTFYLIDDLPGRYASRDIWVEASPNSATERADGMPFRNLNDGVTPVVIGGNDWAAAWAVDDQGLRMLPVGRGTAGERQRELAYRFGVNLVMHVLTGNYKSDQVHVPDLLDRLGE